MADRRVNVRAVVRLEVENRNLERVPLFVTANLSAGGMFLITKNPLPEGTNLRLRFRLPKEKVFIQTLAKVLWVREESATSSSPPGMGVLFLECAPADQERIQAWVSAWAKTHDAPRPAPGEKKP